MLPSFAGPPCALKNATNVGVAELMVVADPVSAGIEASRFAGLRADGRSRSVLLSSTASRFALTTLTTGVSPVTFTVSETLPTFMSALIVMTPAPVTATPSRLLVLNPLSVNVTVYVPGRRSTIWYWPVPSVIAERAFSSSAGLEASTVTPGRTAPDASLATPASVAWANAQDGSRTSASSTQSTLFRNIDAP